MQLVVMVNITELIKMEIKLPKSIKELRHQHLEVLANTNFDSMSILDRAVLCSGLTGLDVEIIRRVSFEDVTNILAHYFKIVGEYEPKELPKSIDVNGNEYCLIDSISKMPTDWHIDTSAFNMGDACNVAAFYYIEEGMEYCELDSYHNIKNPVKERSDLFREHLSIDILIDLRAKFDKEVAELNEVLYGKETGKGKKQESKRYDWENSVHTVATVLKMKWNEVTKNNIHWFKHKCDFIVELNRKK